MGKNFKRSDLALIEVVSRYLAGRIEENHERLQLGQPDSNRVRPEFNVQYRAIGLVLDFIHRLVCGRQIIQQRFGDWICLRPHVDGAG
jgi:hypothetical protein